MMESKTRNFFKHLRVLFSQELPGNIANSIIIIKEKGRLISHKAWDGLMNYIPYNPGLEDLGIDPENEDDRRELELCYELAGIIEKMRPSPEELLCMSTKLCESAYKDMIEREGVDQRERYLSTIASVFSSLVHDLRNK